MFGFFGTILEILEKYHRIHNIVVWIWTRVPQRIRPFFLRRVNPTVTIGVLAVIMNPEAPPEEPEVLLGYHKYRKKIHGDY